MTELSAPQNGPRNISNSEVTTFLSCERQYEYAFMKELAPKETPGPLARGTLGHEAFSRYAQARIDGSSHQFAMQAGMTAFMDAMAEMRPDEIMKVQLIWQRYMDFHKGWPDWTILGTEEQIDLPLNDDANMTMRYDLYIEEKATGKRYVCDFKFTYEFWSPDDHELNPQMPKYISIMRANQYKVDGGILIEIRTRELGKASQVAEKMWRHTKYVPTKRKLDSTLRQHIAASLRIIEFRALPEPERRAKSLPVLNKYGVCAYCNFKTLCTSELDGKDDLTVDMRVNFTKNTYGYNHQEGALSGF